MPLFIVVLSKRTIYNKEKKGEAENKRRENERSQSGHKKALTADSAPDPKHLLVNITLSFSLQLSSYLST